VVPSQADGSPKQDRLPAEITVAIETTRSGGFVLLLVDEGDGMRGDLMVAADDSSPTALNVLLTKARGLLCLALDDPLFRRLGLPSDTMASIGRNPRAPEGGTTIEAARGVSTGISSADRAHTISVAIAPGTTPQDVRRPGHVPVLHAAPGGVLERHAPTEAAVDLAKLAGLTPAAVLCEVLGPNGEMAGADELDAVAVSCGATLLPINTLAAHLREAKS